MPETEAQRATRIAQHYWQAYEEDQRCNRPVQTNFRKFLDWQHLAWLCIKQGI